MQQAVMLAILLAFTSTIMVLYLVLLSRAPIAGMVGVVFTTIAMVLFGAAIWFSSRSGWPAESWSSTAWLVVGYSVIVTTSLIGIGLPLRGSWRFIAAAWRWRCSWPLTAVAPSSHPRPRCYRWR
jgi:multisubunit Na+/H+ antiporter MnhB subunit